MSEKKVIKIGTHDGTFHCDEALAIFLLKLLPKYKDAVIVRSRDQNVLDTCDVVVDVGKIYDHSICRYDHHMRDFNESLSTVLKDPTCECPIKLSSAGLIYCHYGYEIIQHLAPANTSLKLIKAVFKNVYFKLIREIDAIDNGVPMTKEEPAYNISTGISSRVGRLNPAWNSNTVNIDEQFQKAIELVGEEFMHAVNECIYIWLPARHIVKDALKNRYEVYKSGEIILLETHAPWQYHLAQLEKEYNIKPLIKYVIFKDVSGECRVRAVSVRPSSFEPRLCLPEKWGGLRETELDKVSGIDGCIFVHTTRFIGGNKTMEGALKMAIKSLEMGNI
ncbi:PREDICTED: UPF0160 protein [Polistes dominula]|uniref:UPF0160 protein n=1 Tax=Polistes dominula TaxID=743375 RepID=A0ABM1I8P5_POLDO|nr:PREDICTED: UPF0160 protein [Polistes dominula]XP_015176581.1 PREDICTED: UPF0160 protein [Polistes dominula]XP_015176582.1 PREDICTED: UPF0160 protein [Polistes dominula]